MLVDVVSIKGDKYCLNTDKILFCLYDERREHYQVFLDDGSSFIVSEETLNSVRFLVNQIKKS